MDENTETHPEIGRSSVKIQVKFLSRGSNVHGTEVLGIVLLVFGRNFTCLTGSQILLLESQLHAGLAANQAVHAMFALLVDLATHKVWAVHGRLEVVLAEKIDI